MKRLLNLCPYTHLWRAGKRAVVERKLPDTARPGAFVTLLGLFCPFFWLALFTGASRSELTFHAIHSGVVMLIGVVLLVIGLAKDHSDPENRDPSG